MSKYTTELRFICEHLAGLDQSEGYNSVNKVIDNSWNKIFDFDFPIFSEDYRKPLCEKILRHFYTQEICEETYGLWKLRLERRITEVMPYYNQLYQSALLKIEPLINMKNWVDTDEDTTRKEDGKTTSNTTDTATTTRNGKSVTEYGETGSQNTDETGETVTTEKTTLTLDEKTTLKSDETTTNDQTNTETGSNKSTINESKDGSFSEKTTTDRNANNYDIYSDTPQGGLTGLNNRDYFTNARNLTADEDETVNRSGTNGETTERTTTGSNTGTTTIDQDGTHTTDQTGTHTGTNVTDFSGNIKNDKNIHTNTQTDGDSTTTTEESEKTDRIGNALGTSTLSDVFNRDMTVASYGLSGTSESRLLLEFRETFLNIDMMVINDLNNLFFLLW